MCFGHSEGSGVTGEPAYMNTGRDQWGTLTDEQWQAYYNYNMNRDDAKDDIYFRTGLQAENARRADIAAGNAAGAEARAFQVNQVKSTKSRDQNVLTDPIEKSIPSFGTVL